MGQSSFNSVVFKMCLHATPFACAFDAFTSSLCGWDGYVAPSFAGSTCVVVAIVVWLVLYAVLAFHYM